MQSSKIPFFGETHANLAKSIADFGAKSYISDQVWQWVYRKGIFDFMQMTNIAQDVRVKLSEIYHFDSVKNSRDQLSEDGTRKWLVELIDSNKAECVYIPDSGWGSLCVSSQVGCTLSCTFCHTGTQKLVRNMTADEIVGEFMFAKSALSDWPTPKSGGLRNKLTNIVMMGMGEPLYNLENVIKAIDILTDKNGLNLSRRKITLSTSGVVPKMQECGEIAGVNLAVSLHATTDEVRNKLVPLNKKYPIAELIDACRKYPASGEYRRITFEYVMLKDVNDTDDDARRLVQLVSGIPAKINLIPFNPWPGTVYECSSNNRIHAFSRILQNAGLEAPVRTPRGRDILAACGQLRSDSEKIPAYLLRQNQESNQSGNSLDTN